MIDMMKPAGWEDVPGSGFENKRPIKPPTIDPAMPRSADFQKPRCWRPGTRNSAIPPTIAPTTIDQMMCNIGLFGLSRAGYHAGLPESHSFSGRACPERSRMDRHLPRHAPTIGLVDCEIFVARRTKGVEHARFLDRLHAVRDFAGEIK